MYDAGWKREKNTLYEKVLISNTISDYLSQLPSTTRRKLVSRVIINYLNTTQMSPAIKHKSEDTTGEGVGVCFADLGNYNEREDDGKTIYEMYAKSFKYSTLPSGEENSNRKYSEWRARANVAVAHFHLNSELPRVTRLTPHTSLYTSSTPSVHCLVPPIISNVKELYCANTP